MTTSTPRPPVDPGNTQPSDDGPVIDTTGMNKGQAAAMEVAESAREQVTGHGGFGASLFMGGADPSWVVPFPEQSDEDREIGDKMVQRVSAFLAEYMDPEQVDETRTIPDHVIDGLREMGIFKMKVPREYGGLGFSQVNYNRVIVAMASYCGSTTVLVSAHQSIGVPTPLKMFGTDEQKAKWLPRISEGALSAFALTEPEVGSDPAKMTTVAEPTPDGDAYVINGTKLWTTNGPIADLLVVMAQTPEKIVRGKPRKQITAFVVEADTPGVEVVHRCDFMGIRAIQNGVIRFSDVRVPKENVLWGEGLGLKLALKTLNTGRLTLPAGCTGAAKQCLSICRRWGKQREQWGHAIGEHEAGYEKIGYMAATTFAMEAVTLLTSHWGDQGKDIRIEAAMAKLFCSEAAWRIVDMTMQLRGGRGYERAASLRERGEPAYPVERMMRDARINTIIEGTSEIMRLFLAREAIDPHLRMSIDLMRPGVPAGKKAAAAVGLLGFYSSWYPRQWWGGICARSVGGMQRFDAEMRYVNRTSHRLARTLFHGMAKYQQGLEKRQALLGHLMEIGTELFVIAATCAYADRVAAGATDGRGTGAVQLARLFFRQARGRVEDHFRRARKADLRAERAVTKRVLNGEMKWVEDGIVHLGPED